MFTKLLAAIAATVIPGAGSTRWATQPARFEVFDSFSSCGEPPHPPQAEKERAD